MSDSISPDIQGYCEALLAAGFGGEVETAYATRAVMATDNSIYRILPEAVLYPADEGDLVKVVRLAASARFGRIPLTARGGGTGTNGQSLSSGVLIDFSRHMNRIQAFDPDMMQVRVEPGVVLGQLNAYLKPHGYFFPPMVSTADRATIGGMVATDASGKGSRRYGKTSDYVEALDLLLADGTLHTAQRYPREAVAEFIAQGGHVGAIYTEATRIIRENADRIAAVFPKMNRGLTGYNLQGLADGDSGFSLVKLLAGSEGTLAITRSIQLKVARLPEQSALVVIRYASFQSALDHVQPLLASDPLAIEILDGKVLELAEKDVLWQQIDAALGGVARAPVRGLNVVEFAGSAEQVEAGIARISAQLQRDRIALDWTTVREPAMRQRIWELREKSVGLLASKQTGGQGTAFVEDTAVPPESLPAYVAEFAALLDSYGLTYGMFGHADVGCLHVRPMLDMKQSSDAALIRPISDAVVALTKKYGGLLWGEHGRGFRGEYSPVFFGPQLFAELGRIKAVFDPNNVLNPGKLASPDGSALRRIDAVPLRGEMERIVAPGQATRFDRSLACNGNGACFTWDPDVSMCPSYKGTRDRTQSPKGRAVLLRELAVARSAKRGAAEISGLEEMAMNSLGTCLSCKACTTQCPVKVDVPTMRARFFEDYYSSRRRPLRHRAIAALETVGPWLQRVHRPVNALAHARLGRFVSKTLLDMVDLPRFSPPVHSLPLASPARLRRLDEQARARTVVIVQDSFTGLFEADIVKAATEVLDRLDYHVLLAPMHAGGKPLHVLGMMRRFRKVAERARKALEEIAASGVTLVGLEPSTNFLDREEYVKELGKQSGYTVLALDEILSKAVVDRAPPRASHRPAPGTVYRLAPHCTERTARPTVGQRWRDIFAAFGLVLETERTGCCGMAGLFGHERENAELSARIYDLSWRQLAETSAPGTLLATGFSCRCQVERLSQRQARHPIMVLRDLLRP